MQSGDQLAADLSELKMIGEVDLPELVYSYASLNNAINSTSGRDAAAFQAPGDGGTGMCQVYACWSAMRDDLQDIFGTTADALLAAAKAIRHVVDTYAATDEAAARTLRQAWRDGPPPSIGPSEQALPGLPPEVVNSLARRQKAAG